MNIESKLITLADFLDRKGLSSEADKVDNILKKSFSGIGLREESVITKVASSDSFDMVEAKKQWSDHNDLLRNLGDDEVTYGSTVELIFDDENQTQYYSYTHIYSSLN